MGNRNESWGEFELVTGRIMCWIDGVGTGWMEPGIYMCDADEKAIPLGFVREVDSTHYSYREMLNLMARPHVVLSKGCQVMKAQQEYDAERQTEDWKNRRRAFESFMETLG